MQTIKTYKRGSLYERYKDFLRSICFNKENLMIKSKRLLMMCAAIFLFIASAYPFANSASAACSGTGCNGQLASATGCGTNVSTKATSFPASSRLELRRSNNCSTFWTKTT